MSRSSEAFWWSLFSAGGVMAALFVPAFIIATGFLLPTSDVLVAAERTERLAGVLGVWPVGLVLFGVITLSLFHCAHRIRHTLMDLGLRKFSGFLMVPCYGAAVLGSVYAGILLWAL